MIGCLISLIVLVIIVVIVLYILETAVQAVFPMPPPIWMLIRLLAGLLVLLYALGCLGLVPAWGPPLFRYRP